MNRQALESLLRDVQSMDRATYAIVRDAGKADMDLYPEPWDVVHDEHGWRVMAAWPPWPSYFTVRVCVAGVGGAKDNDAARDLAERIAAIGR
jgi:hypothetical protein